jgi:hypothetical protein
LFGLYAVECHPDGTPRLKMPDGAPPPTPREAFFLRCFYNGVTDPATAAEMWVEEQARREAAKKAGEERRKAAKKAKRLGGRKKGGKP